VLSNLCLKRFNLTRGLLFDTFFIGFICFDFWNSGLEPLLASEGPLAQIHMNLSSRVFGRNLSGDLRINRICVRCRALIQ